jgi:hypothetical protein
VRLSTTVRVAAGDGEPVQYGAAVEIGAVRVAEDVVAVVGCVAFRADVAAEDGLVENPVAVLPLGGARGRIKAAVCGPSLSPTLWQVATHAPKGIRIPVAALRGRTGKPASRGDLVSPLFYKT